MVDRARMDYPKLNGELSALQFATLEGTRLTIGNGRDEHWERNFDEIPDTIPSGHPSIVRRRDLSSCDLRRVSSLQKEAPLDEDAA